MTRGEPPGLLIGMHSELAVLPDLFSSSSSYKLTSNSGNGMMRALGA